MKGEKIMKVEGKIKSLDKIIISDPMYNSDVDCRYEKNNLNLKNWNAYVEVNNCENEYAEMTLRGIELFVVLSNPNQKCELDHNAVLHYYSKNNVEEFTIGMDSACVAFGINDNADEIEDMQDIWQPPNSIKTLTDGWFGTVREGKENDKINFIFFDGYIYEDAGYSIQDIANYVINQLQIIPD